MKKSFLEAFVMDRKDMISTVHNTAVNIFIFNTCDYPQMKLSGKPEQITELNIS